jgi:hypothetical protein
MNKMQPQIQLSQTSGYVCASCGHNMFDGKMMVRKVSRFVTGETRDAIIPIDIVVCSSCGEVAKDLLPDEVQNVLFPNVSAD